MYSSIQLTLLNEYLIKESIYFKEDYRIKYDTYFKMGGIVKYFITPKSYEEVKKLILFLSKNKIDYKIIGFTSNIILFDELNYTIIISTNGLTNINIINNMIEVDAGYSLQELVRIAVMNQSKGFEGLEGIPASIGGAIYMNAGAYGYCISDNLLSVECINEENELVTINKDECAFNYRESIFKNSKYTILRAKFKFIKGNRNNIAKNIETFHIARHSYQDYVYPNLGSMLSTGNIYKKILKGNRFYYSIFIILKYLYKNPISKFINRKNPNNNIFNKLLLTYISKNLNKNINYNLSSKNVNILINDGSKSSKELINYMYLIHNLVGIEYQIENELVLYPISSIKEDFKPTYKKIIEYNTFIKNKEKE